MNWKKIRSWALVLLAVNVIGYLLNTIIVRTLFPPCFDSIIESSKATPSIMKKIGDYGSEYSTFESDNYIDGDSANFELRILGNTSIVIFTGIFQKIDGNCRIVKIDTTFVNYEKH